MWTFGWQVDAQLQKRPDRNDYMMVRKYSSNRTEAGRYLARSLFPAGLNPGEPSWQHLRIAVAHDRVGLLAWSGNVSSYAEWVELALDGNLIRRVPIENGDSNFKMAFTADGHLYRHRNGLGQVFVLDQNAPVWHEAGNSPQKWLWGADGNLLVFSKGGVGSIDLEWFEQPAFPESASAQ